MFKFFKNLFFPKTVDDALALFHQASQDLSDFVQRAENDIRKIDVEITNLQLVREVVQSEQNRALSINAKIADFLK